jgi:hypothetical protein
VSIGEKGRKLSKEELARAVEEIKSNPDLYNEDMSDGMEGYEHPHFKGMLMVMSISDELSWGWIKHTIKGHTRWVDAPDMFFMQDEGWRGYGVMTVTEEEHDARFNSPYKVSWTDEPDEDSVFFGPLTWWYGPDKAELVPTKWKAGDKVWPIYFHANNPGGLTLRDDAGHEEYWQAG